MQNQAMNPFENQPEQRSALVEQSTQREAQEVQAMMIIAKKFPRNHIAATDKILQAFTRPTLAEGALYSYPKGGQDVTGPSIRSAEAIAQMWGNLQFGIRELEQRSGESTVEAFAWDLESNTRQVKVFQVPHIRYKKNNQSYALTDPREIYELVANQGARRLRACILGVIPGDVIEMATKQAEATLVTKADISPEAINKMAEAFKTFGVTKGMIEKRIGRRIDTITPAAMVQMKKIYASLRDSMSSINEWFDVDDESIQKESLPALSDEMATELSKEWAKAIESGSSVSNVLSMISSKYTLTADQKEFISALGKPIQPESQKDAVSNNDEWLKEFDGE